MITIAHLITGLETGGAERMLVHLVTRTDRARFRPVVISMTRPGAMGPMLSGAGVGLHVLGIRRSRPDPRGIVRLVLILRATRPALLQSWLYHADLLGLAMLRLGQVPHLVWGVHASDVSGVAATRRILAWSSGQPDAVVTVSLAGQRFHERIGYRPRRWVYIPNGFDTEALQPNEETRRNSRGMLGIAESAVAILLPARYHPMKDHATFLTAAAKLSSLRPEVLFVLAGSGVDYANPAIAVAIAGYGLGDRVMVLGERHDLDALYPAFDIVSLSSAYGEAMPMVLGEAMACGIPCVATDCGDATAIIEDTGILVPRRDPAALAAAWERMIGLGAEGRRALGERARARVLDHYALATTVSRYEALYDEIAAR